MSDKLSRKTIFNLMPGLLMREIVVRKLGRLDLDFPGIRFKIASSSAEIAKAINLVDDCYVARGILDREQKQISTHILLPTTTVFVALRDDEVIGTVSLIEESPLGFPMEEVHPEVQQFRSDLRRSAEVGGLATVARYRKSGLSIMLYNMLYRWARYYRNIEDLIIAVHPSSEGFYSNVLLFEKIGSIREYKKLRGAESVPLHLDIPGVLARFKSMYEKIKLQRCYYDNLYSFFCDPREEIFDFSEHPDYRPRHTRGGCLNSDQISSLLKEFRIHIGDLPEIDRNTLAKYYPSLA
ncbi:MAG: hypothetical protein JWO63_3449 [Frankiales bacterium]|jgi:hypothetical protein|nr:hypothetical protein [Frankiales bacterium]